MSANEKKSYRLLLTGGGTGGHLFPALAAAEEMQSRIPAVEIMFIGTRRNMDMTSLSGHGFHVQSISCYGLKGKSPVELIKALAVLPVSMMQAAIHILRFRPDTVLGVGGYVTGPVVAAAKAFGIRTVIHEQNSVPGLANRLLGKIVDRICISLEQSRGFFPQAKVAFTGNPVRREILELAQRKSARQTKDAFTLLVLGGSQGAHRLNQIVVEALHTSEMALPINVIHQTGQHDVEEVKKGYRENGIEALVEPFFTNMAEIYAQADLLVSRAGATTLAELAVLGKPAILIPYPYAADDHQQKNAEYYVAAGGCLCFPEREITPQVLAAQLQELCGNPARLKKMGAVMSTLGCPQAARSIVEECIHPPANMAIDE